MIWILMILDIASFITLSLAHFEMNFSAHLLFLSGLYLAGKFFVFRDIMSGLDMIAGIYIFLVLLFGISNFMYYLIMIWFMYKAAFTIVGR